MQTKDNNKTPVWDYAEDADITFGEVHASKLPKILLALTFLGLIALGVAAYMFRDYISDYINNPQIQFKDMVVEENGIYSVDAEISEAESFDPNSYILEYDLETKLVENVGYTYTIDDSQFNPNEVGDYSIFYHSSNLVSSEDFELVVHLRDNTPPVISLELDENKPHHVSLSENGNYKLVLTRGKDTQDFDPKNYIASVTDNYTTDNIELIYTDKFDFTASSLDVIYSATDEFGNTASISLTLIIEEDMEAIKQKEEELRKAEEERKKKQEELEAKQEALEEKENKLEQGQYSSGGSSGGNSSQGSYTPPQSSYEEPVYVPEETEKTSISARDVTVSLSACGNDENAIVNQCIAALDYRGSGGSAMPTNMPGFDIPLDVGTYTVTWTTTDGLSCTQTLTITE